MNDVELLTVGQLAKKMNITVRTLQYYDQQDILKPTTTSKGGRRLYSSKDVVKLYQILSLKYLGFSLEDIKNKIYTLDKPEEVVHILGNQQKAIEEKISLLQESLDSITSLKKEVLKMNTINFEKFANIISMLRVGNDEYWVFSAFDDSLNKHLIQRFVSRPELGKQILETYHQLLDEGIMMKRTNESPTSERSVDYAKRWWKMVNDFTGGDMSLLPKLKEFNSDKSKWNNDMALKQEELDSFMEKVLENYFKEMEEDI